MPKIYLTGNRLPQAAAARKAYLHGPFMFIYLEITCYSRVKCVVEDVIPPRQGRRPESSENLLAGNCHFRYIASRLELNLYTSRPLENLALEGGCDIQPGYDIVNI